METLEEKVARVLKEDVVIVHMVEAHFEHWDRLLFRDYLIEHPHVAQDYGKLKRKLSNAHANDRVAYTVAKTDFIVRITNIAKGYYVETQPGTKEGPGGPCHFRK